MKLVKEDNKQTEKGKNLKLQNDQAKTKVQHFRMVVLLLEVRAKHFNDLSKLRFLPLFLKAKYRLKALDIEAEIIAKNHFIQIYSERIVNTKYAENVIQPVNDK